MASFDTSRLASEILLFIFSHIDLHQVILSRRVNKQFRGVIDSNQLLWRIFEWIQKDQESFRPALDMFDEYSRSSLEKVSIQGEKSNEKDLLHLMQVLTRSKETLSEVTYRISGFDEFKTRIVELIAAGSRLRSLVVWNWGSESDRDTFPLSRLAPSHLNNLTSSSGNLQLLWVYEGVGKLDSKHLNSLISFARAKTIKPQDCRRFISSISETLVHLKLRISKGFSTIEPVFCPNLKIFEGWVGGGLSSFLDAPQLQIIVLESVLQYEIIGLPPSVEEIWFRSRSENLHLSENWEPLLRPCPKLRILKLMVTFVLGELGVSPFDFNGILEMLQSRRKMVQEGEEIDGIKIASLQKLVLPTQLISKEELKRAVQVAEEVFDVKDYLEFIEIEY